MLPASVAITARPSPLDAACLQGRLWRGSSLGTAIEPTLPSGFAALDAELPGGGWPLKASIELLIEQPGVLEWRLLAPALCSWWARQSGPQPLLLVNPPHTPHLPGLQALGLPPSALIWVQAAVPAQQLWATEQAIQSNAAVLAWLPEARPEQIRRLQVGALSSAAPVFLMRPKHAGRQSSAAPLRLEVRPGEGWQLDVHLLKRRGPAHEGWLALPAVPSAVAPLLTAIRHSPRPRRHPTMERHDALARPVLHA